MNDNDLLREYATLHSEAAFTTLVEKYLGLIYSAALRRVRDPGLAEEVAQIVCITLARKAHNLTRSSNLSGWLYQATRFAAATAVRSQRHRQQREQEAAQMQANCNDDSSWQLLVPILDQAMDELRERDREVVLLRFFENKSMEGVGSALGISEQAAKKRVSRAVEKLRLRLSRRGPLLSAAVIGGLLSANAVQTAPAGLVTALTATALKGTAIGTSTLALVEGALRTMAWAKIKFAVGLTTALLVAAGGTAVVLLAGAPSSGDAVSGAVHLEGTSTRHLYDPEGNEIVLDAKDEQGNILWHGDITDFSLWQSGCKWKVRFAAKPALAGKVLPGSVSEVACDGTNIYTFVPGAGGSGAKIEAYQNSGSVWPGTLKIFSRHLAPIWWAYCSTCTITHDGPVPDFGMWGPYSGDMQHISSELNLQHATTNSLTSQVGPVESALYRELEAGRLDAVPTAEIKPLAVSTNYGMVFVTRFQLNRYRDSRTMKLPGGPPELLERFDVVLKKAGVEKSRVAFIPEMSGRTMVFDFRLPFAGRYFTKHWVGIEEAQRLSTEAANKMR